MSTQAQVWLPESELSALLGFCLLHSLWGLTGHPLQGLTSCVPSPTALVLEHQGLDPGILPSPFTLVSLPCCLGT